MSIKEIQNQPEYPKKVLKIATFEGFLDLFHSYLAYARTRQEAFEQAREEHYRLFGNHMYIDYDSFRGAIRRYLRKQRT